MLYWMACLAYSKSSKPLEKGNVHRRADLAHLPRQLDARDERHTDVGQQQVRLKPLDKLERVQPVAGIAHKVEAERLPGDLVQTASRSSSSSSATTTV